MNEANGLDQLLKEAYTRMQSSYLLIMDLSADVDDEMRDRVQAHLSYLEDTLKMMRKTVLKATDKGDGDE